MIYLKIAIVACFSIAALVPVLLLHDGVSKTLFGLSAALFLAYLFAKFVFKYPEAERGTLTKILDGLSLATGLLALILTVPNVL